MPYAIELVNVLRNKDEKLYHRLKLIEEIAQPLMSFTTGGFPFYTPHDFLHSKKVEENLNWIITDPVKDTLNAHEVFFAILAAWLHDWGMICKPDEKPEKVRELHHIRTEENFEKYYAELGLDRREAQIVGRISKGHRKVDLRSEEFEKTIFSTNIKIDVPFLAAAVRLADECDLTYNRVPELIYHSLNPTGSSKEHFDKHLSIGGVGIFPDSPYKIRFEARVYDPKGAETIRKVQAKVQEEVNNVKGILSEKGIHIEYVEAKIEARGFIDMPIGFRLDTEKVTKLLIGEGLYERADAAIRELLQNSVDACRLRNRLLQHHEPKISIYLNDGNLVIEDNGIGMSYTEAYNFLSNKGFSYYKSQEFEDLKGQLGFDPISKWGLGALSCFMIANTMEIESKREGFEACSFAVSDVQEGWRYDQSVRKEVGTKITLKLSQHWTDEQLLDSVRYYVRDVEIPIYVGKSCNSPLEKQLFIDPKFDIFDHEGSYFNSPNEYDCIIYDDEMVKVRIYHNLKTGFISSIYSPSFTLVLNQGFRVCRVDDDELPSLSIPPNAIVVLDFKKDVIDLFISREKIRTDTEKFSKFIDAWNQIIIKCFKDEFWSTIKQLSDEGEVDAFTKVSIQEKLCNKFGLSLLSFGTNAETANAPEYKSIYKFKNEDLMVLVLHQNKLMALTSKEIRQLKPKEIWLYLTAEPYEEVARSEIQYFVKYSNNLPKYCIVMFSFNYFLFRNVSYYKAVLREYGLGDLDVKLRIVNIQTMLQQYIYEQSKTPLDELLPPGSFFTSLPDEIRSLAVCIKDFDLELTPQGINAFNEFDYFNGELYNKFTGFPVFLGDITGVNRANSLSNFINELLLFKKTTYKYFKVREFARFVFDIEDEFIKELIKNSKKILSNKMLESLVRNYFSILPSYFILPRSGVRDLLNLREKEILDYIKVGANINPIQVRTRKTASALLKWSSVSETQLRAWTYVKLTGTEKLNRDFEIYLTGEGQEGDSYDIDI